MFQFVPVVGKPAWLLALVVTATVFAGCVDPDASSFEQVETGDALSRADIAAFAQLFDDQPLSDSQSPWPAHLLKWVTEDTFIGTHWNNDDPTQATELNWIVVGKKGVFCAQDRPGPENEWRHFHSYDAPSYDEGHGGEPGEAGYWLTHIAVRDFEAPWGDVSHGVDHGFMHTPAPDCTATQIPDLGGETGSALTNDDISAFASLFDDQPLSDSQSPWPEHLLKWVSKDTFIGTHWNHADPNQAAALNWFVVGTSGTFCADARPGSADDWRHFHSYDAPSYNDGHGGEDGETGYWLLHAAVRDFKAPWGDVSPGVDHEFMFTPAPAC